MGSDIPYDLQALKDGLHKLDDNIQVLEEAIEQEQEKKRDYRRMISVLESKHES